jgi:hypothetical protein
MAFYTYQHICDEYNVIQWDGMSAISKRDDPRECPRCGKVEVMTRIMRPVTFNFAEVDKVGESTKPDSYWENAESEKRRKLIKEQDQTLEKAYYNDPTCPEKYKQLKDCVK